MTLVNFDYRAGILEATAPTTDRAWSWPKGGNWIAESRNGAHYGVIETPSGATVAEVKRLIRARAKRLALWG